jgi:hypothetical protein
MTFLFQDNPCPFMNLLIWTFVCTNELCSLASENAQYRTQQPWWKLRNPVSSLIHGAVPRRARYVVLGGWIVSRVSFQPGGESSSSCRGKHGLFVVLDLIFFFSLSP